MSSPAFGLGWEHVYLTSENPLKLSALKNYYCFEDVESLVATKKTVEQPVNNTLGVAQQRIKNLLNEHPELVGKKSTLIVSIENGLVDGTVFGNGEIHEYWDECVLVAFDTETRLWMNFACPAIKRCKVPNEVAVAWDTQRQLTVGEACANLYPDRNIDPKNWMLGMGIQNREHLLREHVYEFLRTDPVYGNIVVRPNVPKPGVDFVDLSDVYMDECGGMATILYRMRSVMGYMFVDAAVGLEARGFPLAGAIASGENASLILCRKGGKLKGPVESIEYETEYSTDTLEIQKKDLSDHKKIVVVDDVIATGGSMIAAIKLLKRCGAKAENIVGICVLEAVFPDGGPQRGVERVFEEVGVRVHVLF